MTDDERLLDEWQSAAFDYFFMRCNPLNGLIPDTSREGSPASIAGIGFALACYPGAIERGWMTRQEGVRRTLATLRFFWNGPPGDGFDAMGYRGFCYHFLDIKTGKRAWNCELSFIDTSFLVAGMLVAASYFSQSTSDESEIRSLADSFYRRIEWDWALNDGKLVALSWTPESGFTSWRWQGFSEGLILYILGLASPTHPLQPEDYLASVSDYEWKSMYGIEFLYGGPLFMHQFSHAFIDFRGIQDSYMRARSCDYFENSVRATLIQQRYAIENKFGFRGYGENCWGLSAGDGPCNNVITAGGTNHPALGYAARGVPDGPDDGTLMPSATLSSLPFAPDITIRALTFMQTQYPDVIQHHHIPSGFNPSLVDSTGRMWISDGFYALDQGIVYLMIENFRTGSIWALMRNNTYIQSGLKRAGFAGGWLT